MTGSVTGGAVCHLTQQILAARLAGRAMLYAWTPKAEPAVLTALTDEHWRVGEMSCKVLARREIGSGADAAHALLTDPVPRVRIAAARAVAEVGEAEHATRLRTLMSDENTQVSAQASRALRHVAGRTDRRLD